jgi:hypothetical protein
MQYTSEFNVESFQFWSGAKDVIEVIRKNQKMGELQELIETQFERSTPTKTQINDMVWFDADIIYEQLGISTKRL